MQQVHLLLRPSPPCLALLDHRRCARARTHATAAARSARAAAWAPAPACAPPSRAATVPSERGAAAWATLNQPQPRPARAAGCAPAPACAPLSRDAAARSGPAAVHWAEAFGRTVPLGRSAVAARNRASCYGSERLQALAQGLASVQPYPCGRCSKHFGGVSTPAGFGQGEDEARLWVLLPQEVRWGLQCVLPCGRRATWFPWVLPEQAGVGACQCWSSRVAAPQVMVEGALRKLM